MKKGWDILKRRGVGILLSLALAVTSIFSGGAVSTKGAEVQQAEETPAYRNVVYYGDWSIYAGQKNFYPSRIDGSLIHI